MFFYITATRDRPGSSDCRTAGVRRTTRQHVKESS